MIFGRILLFKIFCKAFIGRYFTINCAKKNNTYFSCLSFGVELSSLVILYFIKAADITMKKPQKSYFTLLFNTVLRNNI